MDKIKQAIEDIENKIGKNIGIIDIEDDLDIKNCCQEDLDKDLNILECLQKYQKLLNTIQELKEEAEKDIKYINLILKNYENIGMMRLNELINAISLDKFKLDILNKLI